MAQSADIRGGLLTEKDGPPALGAANLRGGVVGALAPSLSFDAWRPASGAGELNTQLQFRASVARGRDVFFGRTFAPGATTCGTCHSAGITRWMDIGTTNHPMAEADPALPLFRVTCETTATPHPGLGRVIYTQDPGRALVSGKCADVGAIVMQQFRGLAARAPYFSNGSAQTIPDIVEFYERRYMFRFAPGERQDLVDFLGVL